jgi:hypothetical protein
MGFLMRGVEKVGRIMRNNGERINYIGFNKWLK